MSLESRESVWNEDLETGIDVLDTQHKRYFDLLRNYLENASEVSTGSGEAKDLAEKLGFLREYAWEHFSTEEDVMKTSAYPDYDAHKEEHMIFMRHVGALRNRMRVDGYSPGLAREVNYYTAEWFVEHIRVTDMKLVEYLKQKSKEDQNIPIFLKKIYASLFGND